MIPTPSRITKQESEWFLYVIRCKDGSLYAGITTDVDRRFEEHRSDPRKGAKYLRGRGPLELVLRRPVGERRLASRVEWHFKRRKKSEKEAMVADPRGLDSLIESLSSSPRT